MKVKLENFAIMPKKAHEEDAGYDLFAPRDILVKAGTKVNVDTGVHMAIPKGYYGSVRSKSGLNMNFDITSDGVVDSGYTGTIRVCLRNHGKINYLFEKGEKISQILIEPVENFELELVDELEETERGDGGFGSTGR